MRGKKLLQSMLSIFLAGTAFAADPVTVSAEGVEFSLYRVSNETVYADENGDAVVEVGIEVNGEGSAEDVHLQWYEIDEQDYSETLLEGATETVLIVHDVDDYDHFYRCIGTDDAGNTDSIDFNVWPWEENIESGFSIWCKDSSYVEADKNGEVNLQVVIDTWGTITKRDISLQWYEIDSYDDSEVLLPGEISDVLHLTGITESRNFRCAGTDNNGNTVTADFYVYAYEPDFSLYSLNDETSRADENGNAVLEVEVSVWGTVSEEDISLQWYKLNPYLDDDTGVLLNGETSTVLQLSNVTEYSKYRCVGTDQDGFSNYVDLYVYPWSSSQEPIGFDMYEDEYIVKADQNGTAKLKVYVYVYDDSHSEDDISLQ